MVSRIHSISRIDGRVKLGLLGVYSGALFATGSLETLVLLAGLAVLAARVLRPSGKAVMRSLLPSLLLGLFFFLYNLNTLGIQGASVVGVRVVLLVGASAIVVLSAFPGELEQALRGLLAPLGRRGLPVGDITATFSLALRFIPLMFRELRVVQAAQLSRGAHFHSGTSVQRIKAHADLLMPLFVGLFRRAESLACAMDARCFGAVKVPSNLNGRKMTYRDWVVLLGGSAILFAIVAAFH